MNKTLKWIGYLLVGLLALLLFIWANESQLVIPSALQPLGRLHPLVLHLPIGMFVVLAFLYYLRTEIPPDIFHKFFTFLAAAVALMAILAAIFGLFLSREEGYDAESLNWHKWGGILFSLISYAIYLSVINGRYWFNKGLVPVGLISLLAAGHFGGEITHGEGYLTAAWNSEEEFVIDPNGSVSDAAIFPILKKKCLSCHNSSKMKGELNMDSFKTILEGGKNGKIWKAGDAINSAIIQRAHLPINDKKHMPPKGKSQLSLAELDLLELWINRGADTLKNISELAANDSLNLLIESIYLKQLKKAYTFKSVSKETLLAVNTPFCTVERISTKSPALKADFYVIEKFNEASLKALSSVSEQLVSLNLNKMPVSDGQLVFISSFKNLEYLNLNSTNITGENLVVLSACESLKSLSLSGCNLTAKSLNVFSELKSLEKLFLWNTPLSEEELKSFITNNPGIEVVIGNKEMENEFIKLNVPSVINKKGILLGDEKVELKHNIKDVMIRFTTDGSVPDSINGEVFKSGLAVDGLLKLRTLVTKKGWYASDTKDFSYFKSSFKVDSAWLVTPTAKEYPGKGYKTLIDLKQGDKDNFRNLSWLGYKNNQAEIMLKVDLSKEVKGISVGYLINVGSYIMPPRSIELWGGNSENDLKLLEIKMPNQPKTSIANLLNGEVFKIKNKYPFYKIIAKPVRSLPIWHQGKGQKAWLFLDEIYLY